MKRKKWSEVEEQTLLSKYSDLLRSGTLPKLRTREKKFKPIADHVNSIHHLQNPSTFPFKWSWRDVSIKIQNMRHQYLNVKQKIRLSSPNGCFDWNDGLNHWENFLNYKQVFGDVQLDTKQSVNNTLGLGFEIDSDGDGDGDDDNDVDVDDENGDDVNCDCNDVMASTKRLGIGVLRLREAVVKREERRREREFRNEQEKELATKRGDCCCGKWLEERELEMEEREFRWGRREVEKRERLERELEEERRRRKRVEEKMEEEEMEWRERMVSMQVEHEKQMMQMHAEACHNQMQILGVMARILCQFFGSGNDGLGPAGLGTLPPQVLHHGGGGGLENGKPDANSPSEFI